MGTNHGKWLTRRPIELAKEGDLRATSDHQASLSKPGHRDDLNDKYGDDDDNDDIDDDDDDDDCD